MRYIILGAALAGRSGMEGLQHDINNALRCENISAADSCRAGRREQGFWRDLDCAVSGTV
jgi:hypothetical protein